MRILLFTLFSLSILPVFSQENKKITDYLTDLQIDCPSLLSKSEHSSPLAPDRVYPPPPPPPLYRHATSSDQSTDLYENKYAAQFTKLVKHLENRDIDAIKQSKAGIFFQDESLCWGLKSITGKIIFEPKFLHIIPLEGQTNFIGVDKESKRYNVYNKEGKSIFASDYDFIEYENYRNYYLLSNGGKKSVGSSTGEVASAPMSNLVRASSDLKYFIVQQKNKKGVVRSDGSVVFPCTYKKMHFVETNDDATFVLADKGDKKLEVLSVQDGKKYALDLPYHNFVQNHVTDSKYLYFYYKNKAKLIDFRTGEDMYCSNKYELKRILDASNLFRLSSENMHYFFRGNGNMVVPPYKANNEYDTFNFYNDAIPLGKTNKEGIVQYGLFGNNQKWLIEPKYKRIRAYKETPIVIAEKSDGTTLLLNQDGTKVFDFAFSDIYYKVFGFSLVNENNASKRELYDFNAQKIFEIDIQYEGIMKVSDEFYSAIDKSTKEKIILNKEGQIISRDKSVSAAAIPDTELSFLFKFIGYENDKRIVRRMIIDKSGNIIPFLLEGKKVEAFEKYRRIGKSQYYRIEGIKGDIFILNTKNLEAFHLPEGVAIKEFDQFIDNFARTGLFTTYSTVDEYLRKYGLIDAQGNEIFPCIWSDIKISSYNPNYIEFMGPEQSYVYKLDGERMFPQYNYAETLSSNRFAVSKEGKAGVLDADSKQIIPFEYRRFRLKLASTLINAFDFSGKTHVFSPDGKRAEID